MRIVAVSKDQSRVAANSVRPWLAGVLALWCLVVGSAAARAECVGACAGIPASLTAPADLRTDGLVQSYASHWTGRPALEPGYQPLQGARRTLSAGMNNMAAPGASNARAPMAGRAWPTFGNYERNLTSDFVMPNEDAMRLCGVSDLIDWSAADRALMMRIRPLNECVKREIGPASKAKYMSGNLTSYQNFSQLYGVFEVEAKLPARAKGLWPAFWLLSDRGGWPPEIDVVEQIGHDTAALARDPKAARSINVYTTNVISAFDPASHQPVHVGGIVRDRPALDEGFHQYAVDWEPDVIAFYFDRRLVGVVPTPPELKKAPRYWLVGLAAGGGWVGEPDAPVDAAMLVRGISVWRSRDGATGVGSVR